MNVHEYQAKELLKSSGAKVQDGIMLEDPSKAVKAAEELSEKTGTEWWVIKAQVHAGGRGKGGGVKLAKSLEEVDKIANQIHGMTLVTPQTGKEGKLVRKIYIAQDVYYPGEEEPKEFYVSVLLDREKGCDVIVHSTEGGMNIEEVAENTPELVHKVWIDPSVGLQPFQTRQIASNLKLKGKAAKEMGKFIQAIYKAYKSNDATLIEINPCLRTSDSQVLAADAKISVDDNSLFRHKDIADMRDIDEEDPMEVEAGEHQLNFINLDGNVGCMVNGAGLAMATMDIIKLSGGEPANFLDVGGTANAERVEKAFRIILKDKKVEAILVNIFGGIVRCDRVAQGVVDAYNSIGDIPVPIIVRLQGTNAEEAKEIIDKSGLKVHSAILLKDAADLVNQVLSKN